MSGEGVSEETIVDAAAAATHAVTAALPSVALPTPRQQLLTRLLRPLNSSNSSFRLERVVSIAVLVKKPTNVFPIVLVSRASCLSSKSSRETAVGVDACELGDSHPNIIFNNE